MQTLHKWNKLLLHLHWSELAIAHYFHENII